MNILSDEQLKNEADYFAQKLRDENAKTIALKEQREAEIEAKMSQPLHHDEKIIADVDGGYMFIKGDSGVVYHRTTAQHRLDLEARYFVEPERAPQQQVLAKLF